MGSTWEEVAQLDGVNLVEEEKPLEEVIIQEPVSQDTFGLLQVGFLSEIVEIFGHKVSIRTLKVGEMLEAELIVSKYRNTQEENRAYVTALVAACITSVDGRPLVQGLGPGDESFERKFNFVLDNWHWITVSKIFAAYSNLTDRSSEAFEDLKKN